MSGLPRLLNFGRWKRRLESKLDALLVNQRNYQGIIMGQLEDIQASFADSFGKLSGEFTTLHAELAAAVAAGQAPSAATMAGLADLASKFADLAAANAPPAPAPAPEPPPAA